MDLKELITIERKSKPPKIVIHGPHGIGKSTFGANAPAPIFVPTEDGLTTINVPAFPVATELNEVFTYMKYLIDNEHEYQTFVLDTLDWLERLIWQHCCKENNWTSIESPGYGKGYNVALNYWDGFIRGLDKLRDKGMAIVLLSHNEIKTFSPPDNPPYDRWQIKINKSAAAKIEEWADAVLFATFKTYVSEKKAVGGERVLYTSPNPAYRAKNRYGLPEEIPFDFNELIKFIKK